MNSDANAGLEALMKPVGGGSTEDDQQQKGQKRKREGEEEEEEENPNDEVRLWEDGFKVLLVYI